MSPLLVGAAFWLPSFWFFTGFMFIPYFFAIEGISRKKQLFASIFFILLASIVVAYPLFTFRTIQSFSISTAESWLLFLLILGWALFLGLLGSITLWSSLLFSARRVIKIILLPLLWIIFEIVKTKLSFGLQWIFIGEPLIEFIPLAVHVRWGGIYLLSFFVMAANICIFESIKIFFSHEGFRKILPILTFSGIVLAFIVVGIILSSEITDSQKLFTVALVQPGTLSGADGRYYEVLYEKTAILVKRDSVGVDLMVFPGNYFRKQSLNDLDTKKFDEVANFASSSDAFLTGITFRHNSKDYQAHILVNASTTMQASYKEILFPFSEYVPKIFEKFYTLPNEVASYEAGKNYILNHNDGVRIGIISCSEEFIPELARRAKEDGAEILVISGSNDDFLSSTAFLETQRAARFRALENNVYVLQSLKSGISSVIDPYGRILKSLDINEEGILIYDIPIKD